MVFEPDGQRNLLQQGYKLASNFCVHNNLPRPGLRVQEQWRLHACAYWRNDTIYICPTLCASPGRAGRRWSWPGYVVDRTPYGVICHETGHHVDWHSQRGPKSYSSVLRQQSQEPPITSYCPNDDEWFAEIFRLFLTNPDLLRLLRPKSFKLLATDFKPEIDANWHKVLETAPERYLIAAQNKIKKTN